MIDINELRRKISSVDIVDHVDIHANVKPTLTELLDRIEAAEKERDELLEALKWMVLRADEGGYPDGKCLKEARAAIARATGEQPEFVRKAWARFKNELHRSPDAPYPGMSEAFEQHFSQSFTDREWRAESATWAAAWKAAKHHGAKGE